MKPAKGDDIVKKAKSPFKWAITQQGKGEGIGRFLFGRHWKAGWLFTEVGGIQTAVVGGLTGEAAL